MDVTSEKMNARHLNTQAYHDLETGIRNGQFLVHKTDPIFLRP